MASLDLNQLMQMQQVMMQQISGLMETLGVKLTLEKIDIAPEDCPDLCIDFVWRFRCTSKLVCDQFKAKLQEQVQEGGE